MKKRLLSLIVLSYFLISNDLSAQETNNIVGIFDGRTPCQELAKQLNESTIPECIKIKWRLILYKHALKEDTGTYALEGFVFKKDNILKGKWHIIKGTPADADAIVYQLDHPLRGTIYLQKVSDNILFFLDQGKNLMVGNRNFSYTLNRKY